MMMSPERFDAIQRPYLEEGFAKADRPKSLDNFAVCPGVSVVISDDLEKARMPIKAGLALYIGGMGARGKNFYNDHAKRLGYEEAAVRIQDLYLAGKKNEATAAVPDALVDEVHLVGPRGRIRERLAAWREAGNKRQVDTMLIGTGQREALELLAEELL
jgi:alkanesulfonate monooxygenase SsuD/methylene tetrahydromethanopterin reductase-like flavin-dependent oxidoreductase (luciferase family)